MIDHHIHKFAMAGDPDRFHMGGVGGVARRVRIDRLRQISALRQGGSAHQKKGERGGEGGLHPGLQGFVYR